MFLWFKSSLFPHGVFVFLLQIFTGAKQKFRKGPTTFLEKTEKKCCVAWIWAPPTTQILELVNVTPYGKRDFENIIKWGRWGDYQWIIQV